jgi:hypothetical protein
LKKSLEKFGNSSVPFWRKVLRSLEATQDEIWKGINSFAEGSGENSRKIRKGQHRTKREFGYTMNI